MSENIVLITGGFDPIHSGHLSLIKEASSLGRVIIGVNSDEWLIRKKGSAFLNLNERLEITNSIKNVVCSISYNDHDNTSINAIHKVKDMFPKQKIIFANGGDRNKSNVPEQDEFKNDHMVEFVFGVGGNDKKNSSSEILSNWKSPCDIRNWGRSLTYYDSKQSKVKRLELDIGKSISMQYHNKRSEFWFIEEGEGLLWDYDGEKLQVKKRLNKHDTVFIDKYQWHKLENTSSTPLKVIEIQYGEICTEEDIIRL